ncbi:S8 family serine peptidase [Streptomyces sp. NBC_01800]|uniref:S8 family serine peptidase n=1 Tax=Streptomyces sp. NBC_01800 TaxID=2975945 RepID=UPI002DDBD14E|nr:S8 family serine peptidase [Streptomyces sp. NBC_01800]
MTVTSPSAADAALTVGAVERDDSPAPFSSRGPRLATRRSSRTSRHRVSGSSPRAAGTTMGAPLDDHYVAASGTSMATPHLAMAQTAVR